MKNLMTVLVLAIAAGCATLSPLPPQKAATTTELSQCAAFPAGSQEKLLCLYEARAVQQDARQKELEAKIAVLERANKRPVLPAQQPMPIDDLLGEEIPQTIVSLPTTLQETTGDGVIVQQMDWYAMGTLDPDAVGCVSLNGIPMPIDPKAPALSVLIDHGSGRVERLPYRCAAGKMSVTYKNLGPNDVVSITYAHRASDKCVMRQTPEGPKCVHIYREVTTKNYKWNGIPGLTRRMSFDGSPG